MTETKREFSLLTLFLRWRKTYYRVVGIATVLTALIMLLVPNEYITFTTVKGGSSSGFDIGKLMQGSGALSSLGSLADIAMPSSGGQVDYLVALLNSRSIQDSIITRYHLKAYYGTKKIEDTREELKNNTVINKNFLAELVTVGVFHEFPDTAMMISNYYAQVLNSVYASVNAQSARNNREHLERRYQETMEELSLLEDSLKAFQQRFGVYDIETQTSAAIKTVAELKSEVIKKEVEIGVKKRIYGGQSEEIRLLTSEVNQINSKIDEMFDGTADRSTASVFIPFRRAPDLGLQYVRLFRNVKIYTELIKVIVPMLEQARLQERRESPSLVVVDTATLPEKKSRPKRSLYVLAVFFGMIALTSVYVLFKEHGENLRTMDPEAYTRIQDVYLAVKNDLRGMIPWNNRRGT